MSSGKTYVEADWSVGNVTPPLAFNHRSGRLSLQVIVTGTIDFDIESSNSDLQAGDAANWLVDLPTSAGLTASTWRTFNAVPRFIRIKVNSFTTGATVSFYWAQEDA